MIRYFCGMWEYKTQIMNYIQVESFLARLIEKRHELYLKICDKNERYSVAVRYINSDIYRFGNMNRIVGLVLFDKYYFVKVDSFKNVTLVPIH